MLSEGVSQEKLALNRPCPVCGQDAQTTRLHTQRFVLPGDHPLPDRYDLVACADCGCVYCDSPAAQEAYDRYYADMSRYESTYIESGTRLYAERSDWITTVVPDINARIIDVGCGNGRLLTELQSRGYRRLTGLDPSAHCIKALRANGIDGIVGGFFQCPVDSYFDCAILSGVLEHIHDVAGIMRAMARLIRPAGRLLVCVPDAARYQQYDFVAFDYFNIEHINHFEECSLLNLGLRHGMSIVNWLKTDIAVGEVRQPVIYCAYLNEGLPSTNLLGNAQARIVDYVAQTARQNLASPIIDKFVASQEPVVIWGAGNYASRLLASTALGRCRIDFWVDNDSHKQGQQILGRPICTPSTLREHPAATILVAVAVYGEEISRQLREMGWHGGICHLSPSKRN
jgi:SAM-dependent methyltransferase